MFICFACVNHVPFVVVHMNESRAALTYDLLYSYMHQWNYFTLTNRRNPHNCVKLTRDKLYLCIDLLSYRVAKTDRMPYLYWSDSAKKPYN